MQAEVDAKQNLELQSLLERYEALLLRVNDLHPPGVKPPTEFLSKTEPELSLTVQDRTAIENSQNISISANAPFTVKTFSNKTEETHQVYTGEGPTVFTLTEPGVHTIIVEPDLGETIHYFVEHASSVVVEPPTVPEDWELIQPTGLPGRFNGIIINAKTGEDIVIRKKRIIGIGIPGQGGADAGIVIRGQPRSVLIEDVEIENTGDGIVVESRPETKNDPMPPAIPIVTLRRVEVRNIFDWGPGTPHDTRSIGFYGYNITDLYVEDVFFENNGWKLPQQLANTFSHAIYAVEPEIRLHVTRGLFRNASSHAINGHTVSFDGLIASDCAVSFGVKKNIAPQRDGWSLAISNRPLIGYGNQVVSPAWNWYNENPLADSVNVRETDPIDWAKVRAADPADRYDVARGMLK